MGIPTRRRVCVGQLHQIRGGEGGEGREERGGEKREGRGGEVLEMEPDRPRSSHITCLTSVPCIVILCTGMCTAIDTITNWASDVCTPTVHHEQERTISCMGL